MRVVFREGEQRKFMEEVKISTGLSLKQLCSLHHDRLEVGYSALKKYGREESFPSLRVVQELCQIAGLRFDKLKIENMLPDNWGRAKGGKRGVVAMFSKHKDSLEKWRRNGGKSARENFPSGSYKEVVLPPKCEKLSELIGIHLGDGTLTRYFIKISQDPRYDLQYVSYIKDLIEDLFGTPPLLEEKEAGI